MASATPLLNPDANGTMLMSHNVHKIAHPSILPQPLASSLDFGELTHFWIFEKHSDRLSTKRHTPKLPKRLRLTTSLHSRSAFNPFTHAVAAVFNEDLVDSWGSGFAVNVSSNHRNLFLSSILKAACKLQSHYRA